MIQEEFEDAKGQSESVDRRRTDNTMAERKSTKGQTTIYKHTYKTKDRVIADLSQFLICEKDIESNSQR